MKVRYRAQNIWRVCNFISRSAVTRITTTKVDTCSMMTVRLAVSTLVNINTLIVFTRFIPEGTSFASETAFIVPAERIVSTIICWVVALIYIDAEVSFFVELVPFTADNWYTVTVEFFMPVCLIIKTYGTHARAFPRFKTAYIVRTFIVTVMIFRAGMISSLALIFVWTVSLATCFVVVVFYCGIVSHKKISYCPSCAFTLTIFSISSLQCHDIDFSWAEYWLNG